MKMTKILPRKAPRFAAYVVIAHLLLSNTRFEFLSTQKLSLHDTVRRR